MAWAYAALAGANRSGVMPVCSASANRPVGGCPSGFQRVSVADLTTHGHHVSSPVDSPASGAVGQGSTDRAWISQPKNGDSRVRDRLTVYQTTPFGAPLYQFVDIPLPAKP